MKKNVIIITASILLIVFLFSGTMIIKKVSEQRQGEQIYEAASMLSGIESKEKEDLDISTEDKPAVFEDMDLAKLREKNEDVFGWIYIPGADISYPLLDGEDNTYYLTHTWDRQWNQSGSIFLEQGCSKDLSDFNTIIYGHNMRNGTMLSNLKSYMDGSYLEKAPRIYIASEENIKTYDIYAAYEAEVNSSAFWLNTEDENLKQQFIDESLEKSLFVSGVVPNPTDHILTLSTCTGNGHEKRMIVQAVLKNEYNK